MSLSSIKVNNTQLNWDDEPTVGSENLVKSSGILESIRNVQLENSGFSVPFSNASYHRFYFGITLPIGSKIISVGDTYTAPSIYLIPEEGEPFTINVPDFLPYTTKRAIIGFIPTNNSSGNFVVEGKVVDIIQNKIENYAYSKLQVFTKSEATVTVENDSKTDGANIKQGNTKLNGNSLAYQNNLSLVQTGSLNLKIYSNSTWNDDNGTPINYTGRCRTAKIPYNPNATLKKGNNKQKISASETLYWAGDTYEGHTAPSENTTHVAFCWNNIQTDEIYYTTLTTYDKEVKLFNYTLNQAGWELNLSDKPPYQQIYLDYPLPSGKVLKKTRNNSLYIYDKNNTEVFITGGYTQYTLPFDVVMIIPVECADNVWIEGSANVNLENYYTKQEVYNNTEVYNKTETNGLLDQKANTSDVTNSFNGVNGQISNINDTLSTLVESATPLSQINKIINVADFGFLPEATATVNTDALNNALYGGNKTVVISKAGTYKLNGTVRLYDNTTLICTNGVILQKDSVYSHVFLNEGAEARRENKNIKLFGLNIDVNGKETVPARTTALYGLRAQVALLCTKDVIIKDFICTTLGNYQYCIQANTFDGLYIYNVNIEGAKDGIHLSDGNNVVIKNGIINTQDDPVAFNSSDWDSSNCVDGTVQNAIVENLYLGDYNGSSGHVRMLVGAWVDWYSGMSIKRGDRVVSNGRVYRACTSAADGTVYTSQTQPTTTDYSDVQNDAGGFVWKLMKSESYYQTNVRNITIRNCVMTGHSAYPMCEVDTTSVWNRSLYPDVAIADYPSISEIAIEDCQLRGTGGSFYSDGRCNTSFVFERCKIGPTMYCIGTIDSSLYAQFNFNNMHFIGKGNNDCIFVGSGCTARIFNCQTKNNLVSIAPKSGSTTESDGRIISNCNIDKTPLGAVKGDTIITNNIPKIYNGSSWVSLI